MKKSKKTDSLLPFILEYIIKSDPHKTPPKKFFSKLSPIIDKDRKKFIAFLKAVSTKHSLKKYFPVDMPSTMKSPLPSDSDILIKLTKLNNHYGFFEKALFEHASFKKHCLETFKTIKFVADFIENSEHDEELPYIQAYKVLALFVLLNKCKRSHPLTLFQRYISHYYKGKDNPVYNALDFDLPRAINIKNPKYIENWKKLIIKAGAPAMQRFPMAAELKKHILSDKLAKGGFTLRTVKTSVAKVSYKRFSENPAFAKLCLAHHVGEIVFNKCLAIIKSGAKTKNSFPNILIDGKKITATTKAGKTRTLTGYYLLKLPIADPMALIVGYPTHCCQSVSSYAEKGAIDTFKRENNSLCVLLKAKTKTAGVPNPKKIDYEKFDVIGQGYLLKAISGNLFFETWESRRETDFPIVVSMLTAWAKKAMKHDPNIWQVTIGKTRKTPEEFSKIVIQREYMIEGNDYGYADTQVLISTSDRASMKIKELYNRLKEKVKTLKALPAAVSLTSNSLILHSADSKTFTLNLSVENLLNHITSKRQYDFFLKHFEILTSDIDILSNKDLFIYLISPSITQLFSKKKTLLSDLKNLYMALSPLCMNPKKTVTRVIESDHLVALNISIKEIILFLNELSRRTDLRKRSKQHIINLLFGKQTIGFYKKYSSNPLLPKFPGIKKLIREKRGYDKLFLLTSIAIKNHFVDREKYKVFPSFDFLKNLNYEEIEAFTSLSTIRCYHNSITNKFCPSFTLLKYIDTRKVKALTSIDAKKCYENRRKCSHFPSFNDLKDLSLEQIYALTSSDAKKCYEKLKKHLYFPSVSNLKGLCAKKIKALTSMEAQRCYVERNEYTCFPSFSDLQNLSLEKIKLLTSWDARECFEQRSKSKYFPSFCDLKDLSLEKIHVLTNYLGAAICYEQCKVHTTFPSFNDLKSLSLKRINILTSTDAIRYYSECSTYKYLLDFSYLKDLSFETIKTLISAATVRKTQEKARSLKLSPDKSLSPKESLLLMLSESYRRYSLSPGLFTKEKLTDHLRSALPEEAAAAVATSTPSVSAH